MNYISILEKTSLTADVKIYCPKESKFDIDGKMAAKRIFDDFGCDSGMVFYYKYDEYEFSFIAEHIVFSLLFSMLSVPYAREMDRWPLNKFQEKVIYVDSSGKTGKSLKILLFNKDGNKSIDFVLENEDGDDFLVMEIGYDDFSKLISSLKS